MTVSWDDPVDDALVGVSGEGLYCQGKGGERANGEGE